MESSHQMVAVGKRMTASINKYWVSKNLPKYKMTITEIAFTFKARWHSIQIALNYECNRGYNKTWNYTHEYAEDIIMSRETFACIPLINDHLTFPINMPFTVNYISLKTALIDSNTSKPIVSNVSVTRSSFALTLIAFEIINPNVIISCKLHNFTALRFKFNLLG